MVLLWHPSKVLHFQVPPGAKNPTKIRRGTWGGGWLGLRMQQNEETKTLGGGFKYFLFSPRKLGKMSNLTSIFFKWVETTNQNKFMNKGGVFKGFGLGRGGSPNILTGSPQAQLSVSGTEKKSSKSCLSRARVLDELLVSWKLTLTLGIPSHCF